MIFSEIFSKYSNIYLISNLFQLLFESYILQETSNLGTPEKYINQIKSNENKEIEIFLIYKLIKISVEPLDNGHATQPEAGRNQKGMNIWNKSSIRAILSEKFFPEY